MLCAERIWASVSGREVAGWVTSATAAMAAMAAMAARRIQNRESSKGEREEPQYHNQVIQHACFKLRNCES
jgi:hypothetical protein